MDPGPDLPGELAAERLRELRIIGQFLQTAPKTLAVGRREFLTHSGEVHDRRASAVTRRTVDPGLHVIFGDQFVVHGSLISPRFPLHVEYVAPRTDVVLRMVVALEAPAHLQ